MTTDECEMVNDEFPDLPKQGRGDSSFTISHSSVTPPEAFPWK